MKPCSPDKNKTKQKPNYFTYLNTCCESTAMDRSQKSTQTVYIKFCRQLTAITHTALLCILWTDRNNRGMQMLRLQ